MGTTDRVLGGAVVVLALALGSQLLAGERGGPRQVLVADWAELPASLEEAAGMAEEVVRARVTRIRPGADLVTKVGNEPGGEDRIPTEVVTLQVQHGYKTMGQGGPPETVEVFHLGRSEGQDHIAAVEDPPYARGEEYVLFLRPGPEVRVGGATLKASRIISPRGRYRVKGGRMEPTARGGWPTEFRGRPLDAFETAVRGGIERSAGRRQGS